MGLEREVETVNFLCPFSLRKGLLFDTCHWGQYTSPRLTDTKFLSIFCQLVSLLKWKKKLGSCMC